MTNQQRIPLLTIEEAAKLKNCSTSTIYRLIREGKIACEQEGKKKYIVANTSFEILEVKIKKIKKIRKIPDHEKFSPQEAIRRSGHNDPQIQNLFLKGKLFIPGNGRKVNKRHLPQIASDLEKSDLYQLTQQVIKLLHYYHELITKASKLSKKVVYNKEQIEKLGGEIIPCENLEKQALLNKTSIVKRQDIQLVEEQGQSFSEIYRDSKKIQQKRRECDTGLRTILLQLENYLDRYSSDFEQYVSNCEPLSQQLEAALLSLIHPLPTETNDGSEDIDVFDL